MMATMLSMTLLYPECEWLAQLCDSIQAHQHESEINVGKFAKCV